MSSKLRIRIGEVEIDYEGTEEFLKQELPRLLETAMKLHGAAGGGQQDEGRGAEHTTKTHAKTNRSKALALTTSSIAAKLKVASGPDLLTAAAAQLGLVQKLGTFSRQLLLTEMQTATAYYRKTYSNNLSAYIKTALQKGPLTESAKNAYALTAAARADLETKLADN